MFVNEPDINIIRAGILVLNSVVTLLVFFLFHALKTKEETFLCKFHLVEDKSILDFQLFVGFLFLNTIGFLLIIAHALYLIPVIRTLAYLSWLTAFIALTLLFGRWWWRIR